MSLFKIVSGFSILSLFILIIFLFNYFDKITSVTSSEKWDKIIELRSQVFLRFKSSDENEKGNRWLTMEISAPTTGYIGIGFSPTGGMNGGNLAVGWVDSNGAPHLKEFHAENFTISKDLHQDVFLLSGNEKDGRTKITFKRLWKTCDSKDYILTTDTIKLVWAIGADDLDEIDYDKKSNYHGNNRGTKNVFLLDEGLIGNFPDESDPNVKYLDLKMNKNEINEDRTTYYCKIARFPDINKKHHMIGYKPLISKENLELIHHIVAFECFVPPEHGGTEKKFEQFLNHTGGKCYTTEVPTDWDNHCFTFLFVWLVGSEGEMFPQHIGYPIHEKYNGPTYLMLQVHYTNSVQKTFIDSSGLRIYYTDKLREFDSTTILTGARISPFTALPPKQHNFKLSGICSSECTQNTLPPDGIKVFGAILHAHLAAKKIRTRHFRDGKELGLIAQDNSYDFNYQQARYFKNEIHILPGDEIITECEYDSRNRNVMTLGGMESVQEMCLTHLFVYPRVAIDYCTSQPEFYSFFASVGIQNVSGEVLNYLDLPYHPKDDAYYEKTDESKALEGTKFGSYRSLFDHLQIEFPSGLKNYTVGEYLTHVVDWEDENYSRKVADGWNRGDHNVFCSKRGKIRVPLKKYELPLITKGITKPKNDILHKPCLR